MKYLKWVLLVVLLALGGWFLFSKLKPGKAAKIINPTASTGTFAGFDNFFSGLLNKPNYNPGGTAANNISQILNSSRGLVGDIGKLFGGGTNAAPSVSSGGSVTVPADATTVDWPTWDAWGGGQDWSVPSYYDNYNDPGNGAG